MEDFKPRNICKIATMLIAILFFISYPQKISAKSSKVYINFVKTKCNTTTYPSLCIKTLTPHASKVKANSLKLCNLALNVARKAAGNAWKTVSKVAKQKGITSMPTIKDCIGDMKDVVYELKLTFEAVKHLGDDDREFQWANAKTYASAAITDLDSCMDGVLEGEVSASVEKKIRSSTTFVDRLASNALSLINHLY